MAKRLSVFCALGGLIAVLALTASPTCHAQDATFAKANNHYKNGEFREAIADYESILAQGQASAALYFNLGNAYFRRHQLGHALLNYERARRLQPRDPDIQTNLRLARAQRTYARPPRTGFLKRLSRIPFQWISLDEATIGVLLLYAALMTVLCIMTLQGGWAGRLKALARVLAVIFVLGLSLLYVNIRSLGRDALVVRPRAEARFAPFEKATAHFELSEGMAVTVIEENQGWLKVERPDGKTGWVPQDTIALI